MALLLHDWRFAPDSESIIALLMQMLRDIDDGEVCMQTAVATSQGQIEEVDKMARRRRHFVTKKCHEGSREYFFRLVSILEALIEGLILQDPAAMREWLYAESYNLGVTSTRIKEMLHDIALTIGVHSLALGQTPLGTGKVFLPEGVTIENEIVTNIFKWRKTGGQTDDPAETRAEVWRGGKGHTIEPLTNRIKVQIEDGLELVAVLVTEHRNAISKLSRVNGCIAVGLGGQGSLAAKEFLHMLSEKLPDVPFLYFSDHDVRGFQIFGTVKYGSRNTCESNPIQVCPDIEWCGPTKHDLRQSVIKWAAEFRKEYRAAHKELSDEALRIAELEWVAEKSFKITKVLRPLDNVDRTLVTSMRRRWLSNEPSLDREITTLEQQGGMFRFADMTQVDRRYLDVFLRARVAAQVEKKRQTRAQEQAQRAAGAVAIAAPQRQLDIR